ncbi:hypothetical protein BCR36DRAFT_365730 [Piromyces finnis]|uniref:tRNA ligase n=1 Tax=Piromyces finnis TaxID=1754191 RepID=A0A1Y1VP26_9FUNG|nr:hypothetical protein BCR36DRAFT_365730 [Piromyces finnis]|eukprot:ORX61146.1 hypothetical protein BCR36DRAFT_365730 [Piromyces finnis]
MEKIIEYRNKSQQYPRLFKITKLIHPKTKEIIESFHIQESAFKRRDIIPFPARGCFVLPKTNEIIIRGYDKFFNVNETDDTQWINIETQTVGPYELTLKENGCIIFVGVYEDDLLVTSKHSFTKINNATGNLEKNEYSDLGEEWLNKYIGDKREQLIKYIKEKNITLVFELVDNDFQEHVLEYKKEENGLYLHGVNENSTEFKSWPSEKVKEVAKEFNLLTVEYMTYNNIKELKEFAESCNGYYNGKAIEGWVVRCTKKDNGEIFFFKYKYDEPYLLYREWREATTSYINRKPLKYKFMKTYGYMEWIKQKYETNKELFVNLKNKKGIIKLRNLYLQETEGGDSIPKHVEPVTKETALYKLILPISVIGFGKTTVGRMLNILYDVGHVQSDNIQKKKPAPEFIANVCNAFDTKKIVIADKNNFLRDHRSELCEKLKSIYPTSLWIIALYWNIETVPENDILEFTRERIEQRGENHQNLTPNKTANYLQIIKMFLKNYQNLDLKEQGDDLIDEVVEVKFKEDSISIVKKLIETLDLEPKTEEELQDALKKANEMKPEVSAKSKNVAPIYYGLRMKYFNCKDFAIKVLQKNLEQHSEFAKEYEDIKFTLDNSNFLQRDHVTMAFRKRDPKDMINYYDNLIKGSNQVDHFNDPNLEVTMVVSSIVWTNKLVFLPVDTIESDKIWKPSDTEDTEKALSKDNVSARSSQDESLFHITLASYGDAKPVECRFTLQKINEYYEKHKDVKPMSNSTNQNLNVIDENYCIDHTNQEEKESIIHPSTLIQLLPPSIKDTSFIKIGKCVEGPNWKQLFFEPFKFKGFYTKFFY